MKKTATAFLILFALTGCNESKNSTNSESMDLTNNPLLVESTLPYFTPDFSTIQNAHFKPAILEGIRQQKEAVEKIALDKEEATFENTIVALEKSNELLQRVLAPFYALTGAHTNDTLQAVQEEIAPLLAEKEDFIYLNDALFARVKELFNKKESLNLDPESLKLLEVYFENFEIAGANLSSEKKEELKKINASLATLSAQFNKTLLAANNEGAVIFKSKEDLAGLSDSEIESRKVKDSEEWKIPLLNTTQQPLLVSMSNRDAREKPFKSAWFIADGSKNDTKSIVLDIVQARAKKA
ncbi:MAG: dipeptidyl carboxypeptidase II, partial [Ginsengibacter sp.]